MYNLGAFGYGDERISFWGQKVIGQDQAATVMEILRTEPETLTAVHLSSVRLHVY